MILIKIPCKFPCGTSSFGIADGPICNTLTDVILNLGPISLPDSSIISGDKNIYRAYCAHHLDLLIQMLLRNRKTLYESHT